MRHEVTPLHPPKGQSCSYQKVLRGAWWGAVLVLAGCSQHVQDSGLDSNSPAAPANGSGFANGSNASETSVALPATGDSTCSIIDGATVSAAIGMPLTYSVVNPNGNCYFSTDVQDPNALSVNVLQEPMSAAYFRAQYTPMPEGYSLVDRPELGTGAFAVNSSGLSLTYIPLDPPSTVVVTTSGVSTPAAALSKYSLAIASRIHSG